MISTLMGSLRIVLRQHRVCVSVDGLYVSSDKTCMEKVIHLLQGAAFGLWVEHVNDLRASVSLNL